MGKLLPKYGTKTQFIGTIVEGDGLYALSNTHELYHGDIKLDNVITLASDTDVVAFKALLDGGCFDDDGSNPRGNEFVYATNGTTHTGYDDGLYFLHKWESATSNEMIRLYDSLNDADIVRTTQLATVATSGSYNDLLNRPADEVFVATYNTTAAADITSAWTNQKLLVCKYTFATNDTIIAPCVRYSSASGVVAEFTCIRKESSSFYQYNIVFDSTASTPWSYARTEITSGGGGTDSNPALVVRGTTTATELREHYNNNRMMYLIYDSIVYICDKIYIDDSDNATYRFVTSTFGKEYGLSGDDIASTMCCITFTDTDGWLGPWRNTCLGEAPLNTNFYTRKNGVWTALEQIIPVVTYKGDVSSSSALPEGPTATWKVTYNQRTVVWKLTFLYETSTKLSGFKYTVLPDDDTTNAAWLRNDEPWQDNNVTIDGVTIGTIGFSVDSHTYEKGDITATITLDSSVTVSGSSKFLVKVLTWKDTTPDGTDHTGEWSTTQWTFTLGNYPAITKGDCYKATDTGLNYYFDGSEWVESDFVCDHSLIPAGEQLVGGTSSIATYTIQSTLVKHETVNTSVMNLVTTGMYLQDNCFEYYVPNDMTTHATAIVPDSLGNGTYRIYCNTFAAGSIYNASIPAIDYGSRSVTYVGGRSTLTDLGSTTKTVEIIIRIVSTTAAIVSILCTQ